MVFSRKDSDKARLLYLQRPLIAPDWIIFEVHHATWKRWQRNETTREAVASVDRILRSAFDRLESSDLLSAAACRFSIELNHAVYDCLYIALAERENATLLSADEAQIRAAHRANVSAEKL